MMDPSKAPDQNTSPEPPAPAGEGPQAVPPRQLPPALATAIGVIVLLVLAGLLVAIATGTLRD